MEEEGEVHRRGPLVLCPFGGEEYCCVDDPFGLDLHQQGDTYANAQVMVKRTRTIGTNYQAHKKP
jgi:hypothetical protein